MSGAGEPVAAALILGATPLAVWAMGAAWRREGVDWPSPPLGVGRRAIWRRCGLDPGPAAVAMACLLVGASAWLAAPAALLWPSLALGWALLTLSWIDIERLLLPDFLTLPLLGGGLALRAFETGGTLLDGIVGAALGYAVFALAAVVYERRRGVAGLGLGDAKLLAAFGAWIGWAALSLVITIAASGALAFLLARRWRGRADAAGPTPFGPFLAASFWVVWLSIGGF